MEPHFEENDDEPLRCKHCRRRLDQGSDAVSVTDGVIGQRGLVRLDERFYCGEECLRDDVCDAPPAAVSARRVP